MADILLVMPIFLCDYLLGIIVTPGFKMTKQKFMKK